jgi:hypothetical protein
MRWGWFTADGDLFMKKSILCWPLFAASGERPEGCGSTIAATQMTDVEMDTLTAGAANFQEKCN